MNFFLFVLAFLISSTIEDEVRISSADELIELINVVNNGTDTFSGTTVFLDSDLDLAGKTFEPFGCYESWGDYNYFLGTFDGQGHVISNLATYPSSRYAGLFGYSTGLTIRNVILDSSCSITSSYDSYYGISLGGIIGECYVGKGPCTIENSVNMASVSFTGSLYYSNLYLGGIIGYLYSYSYDYNLNVNNCANYGDVTHSGESEYSYIGGIVGYSYGSSSNKMYIYNSLSYGTITHSGTSNELHLGAIAGHTEHTTIENCVSAGKISSTGTANSRYVGSIVGYIYSDTSINYCYLTSELNNYNKYGYGSTSSEFNVLSYNSATFELDGTVSVGSYTGTSLINALNTAADYYEHRDYSHWLLNKNSNAVSFTVNKRTTPISMNYQVILLPSLANEGSITFDGWYEDSALTKSLTSYETTSDATLYGKWEVNTNRYTITFETRREGVSVDPITAQFGSNVTLPRASTADGYCSVAFWENQCGYKIGMSLTMPAHNIALYAVWKCTYIKTPEDFIGFSNIVNNKIDIFEGTTVFLDSDLDLVGKTFEPIGRYGWWGDYNYFRGVFDGQGYVISNLAIKSFSEYVGLFGYSDGLTIRNVILDSSCSVTSSSNDNADIGGFIGGCYTSGGPCTIENSVNMASVSFTGAQRSYSSSCLGGIAGGSYLLSYDFTMKNCANYGDLTHSGKSENSYIGGIVGDSSGDSSTSNKVYVYNSLNYGTITYSGTTEYELHIGGITGYTKYTAIENCVSAGKISSTGTSSNNYTGSIAGDIKFGTSISHCYVSSELNSYSKYGGGTPSRESYVLIYDSTTFELNRTVSIGSYTGTSLINALNAAADYYTLRGYSHWFLNKNKKAVTFTINGRTTPISMNYQIIITPSLASEGRMSFDGWYEDSVLTKPLTSYEVTNDKAVYGKWAENTNNYIITFDTRREGVSVAPIAAQFGSAVALPSVSSADECSVGFWENKYGDSVGMSLIIPAHNITLYAVWKCTNLKTLEDFADFTKIVSSETDTFEGTTVFLDSDLDLAGKTFEPIGSSEGNDFRGVFDGQGHVISNLAIKSSSDYVGLFGYSEGLTIRNVILDSSCSVTSSFSDDADIGGIIGECCEYDGPCTIENSVNMASVSFTGDISNSLHLGGIVGSLYSSSYGSIVKNCANYGSVINHGVSEDSHIGGIVGFSEGYSSNKAYIYNSLNYGTITHSGTTEYELHLGGIAGYTERVAIENCVSAGKISSTGTASDNYIGSISGYVSSNVSIAHCRWISDVGCDAVSGTGSPEVTDTSLISTLSSTTMNELNEYAESQDSTWSRWVMLHLNGGTVSSNISKDTQIAGLVKGLPVPVMEGGTFDYWCVDEACSEVYDPSTTEVSGITDLYAHWSINQYTLTFESNGGSECPPITEAYNTPVTLPEPTKTGHTFAYWCSDIELTTKYTETKMPAENKTLYAKWDINQYTITFDFGNGTVSSAVLDFNATIEYPEDIAERKGFTFAGWDPKPETMPAENTTIKAQWDITDPTECVEVVFSENLTEEGVVDIIKEFVPDGTKVAIEKVESGPGETTVAVKFANKDAAKEFIETISTSSETKKSSIKAFGFAPGDCSSFSPSLSIGILVYSVLGVFFL